MKSGKMLKKISALLAGATLMGCMSGFTAYAANTAYSLFTDNFDSYENEQAIAEAYNNTNALLENANGNRYLKISASNASIDKKFGKTLTDGIINVKYKVKPAADNRQTLLQILHGDGDATVGLPYFNNGAIYGDWGSNKIAEYTSSEWYDVEVELKKVGTNCTYDLTIKETQSGTSIVENRQITFGECGNISGIRLQMWGDDGIAYFDDIKITYQSLNLKMPYEQDFETVDLSDVTMRSGSGEISTVDGDKVFGLAGGAELSFKTGEINSGKITFEANVRTGEDGSIPIIYLRHGGLDYQAVIFDGGNCEVVSANGKYGIYNGWGKKTISNTCAPNTWYSVKLNIDIDAGTMDTVVSDKNNNEIGRTTGVDYKMGEGNTDNVIDAFGFYTWADKKVYIDDVKITGILSPYNQDFENNDCGLIKNYGNVEKCELDGRNVLKVNGSSQATKNIGLVSDGKIYIDTDLYPDDDDVQAQIFAVIETPYGEATNINLLGFNSSTGIRCGWDGSQYMQSFTKDTWYHINLDVNVATGKMNGIITDGNGNSGILANEQIFEPGSIVKGVYFQNWKDNTTFYLDNISISNAEHINVAKTEVTTTKARANVIVNADKNATVILAAYDGDKLLGVDMKTVANDNYTALEVDYSVEDVNNVKLKAFLWNMQTLAPLTESVTR